MDNRRLGIILLIISVILGISFSYLVIQINKTIEQNINFSLNDKGECLHEAAGGICPYEQKARLSFPIYLGGASIFVLFLFSLYLIFSKKPKGIKEEAKQVSKEKTEDKFNIILSALNEDEQKIMKAVKEQDGITQSTLRIRTDMSKTKLSLDLKELEKKNLIKKVSKGKINQIFLKRAF